MLNEKERSHAYTAKHSLLQIYYIILSKWPDQNLHVRFQIAHLNIAFNRNEAHFESFEQFAGQT